MCKNKTSKNIFFQFLHYYAPGLSRDGGKKNKTKKYSNHHNIDELKQFTSGTVNNAWQEIIHEEKALNLRN